MYNTVREIEQGGVVALDRQQVVDEALELLDDEGLDALSLRALAGRLGVQAPTLYWHIGSKAELLDALADESSWTTRSGRSPDPASRRRLGRVAVDRSPRTPHRDAAPPRWGPDRVRRPGNACHGLTSPSPPCPHSSTMESSFNGPDSWCSPESASPSDMSSKSKPPRDATQQAPDVAELQRRFPVMVQAIGQYFSTRHSSDDLYLEHRATHPGPAAANLTCGRVRSSLAA